MCIDDVKATFSKKADLKHAGGKLLTPYQQHHHGAAAAHVAASAQMPHNAASPHAVTADAANHHTDGGYQSQLLSLEHETGMTGQFHLPAVEHLLT
jgi:hypothetical protein